jgi:glutamyl-tRNA reductase
MLRLGLVGASIHQAPVDLLAKLTIPREERAAALRELADSCGFEELVYIATCNRVEFIFQTTGERPIHVSRNRLLDYFFRTQPGVPFQPEHFYMTEGIEAARHLCTVASALDSLVIGEAQILGQIKDAYAESEALGLTGEVLQKVFQSARHCAKKVRRETELGTGKVSIINLAVASLQEFVERRPASTVAIIGAGSMTHKLAEAFRGFGVKEIYFINRTQAKANELARRWQGTSLSLAAFLAAPPDVDIVCSATGAPSAIIGRDEVERLLAAGDPKRPLLLLDLAIPRDVADDVSCLRNVQVYHLETLRDLSRKNRRERFRAADQAREVIAAEVERFHKQMVESTLSPLVDGTHAKAQAFAETGLDALFARKLQHLGDADKDAIRYWVTRKLVPNVLHMPTKAIAASAGPEPEPGDESADDTGAGDLRVHGLRLSPPKC